VETGMIFRLSLALLRLFARIVPSRQRAAWIQEWESEFRSRRRRLAARDGLTPRQEVDMLRRVLGSFHDAAWLRRQFTLDADVMHDVRYGARLLRRAPGFTFLAVTVLALGIGATTGIFSVADALLIRQLPYREPERIVLLFEAAATNRTELEAVAPANFIDWQEQARSLEMMAAAEPSGFTYTGGSEPQSLPGMRVTKAFFDVFGMEPLYGRTFTADEYTAGRNRVVVLSYGTWTQRFGADRATVGRAIRLNGQPYTVVGIMPPTFAPRLLVTFNERGVWTPKIWSESDQRLRGGRSYNAVARLKPGVTIAQLQSELDGLSERLAQQYPRTNAGKVIQVVSLRDHLAGDLRSSIGVLAGAVALLLVIAMANTANLLMARSAARTREIAVRSAIGADRSRLMRQLLAETLLLAAAGCVLGLLVAYGTTRLIVLMAPPDIPALATIGVNGRVLLFSSALTLIVTILVGIIPAWRGAGIRVSDAMSAAASGAARVAHNGRGRGRFVVAELALALVLLTAGGLLLRSFSSLVETSPGFRPEGVAAVQVFARQAQRTPGQLAAFFQQIVDGMRALPHVQEAGAASVIPFLDTTGGSSVPITIDGRPAPAGGEEPSAFVNVATPGYFPAMRIPLLEGRIFDEHDNGDRAPVAVVSRTFAETHWRESSPVGQRVHFTFGGAKIAAEIIGVVGDVRHDALDRPANQELFVPHAQVPLTDMTFVARTAGDAAVLLAGLKSQIYAAAPAQAVYRTAILQDLVGNSLNDRRFMLTLVLAFALLAAALAATGVYGVMSVVSTQRTKEYGLRVALGAGRAEILRMVMREGVQITLVGIAIGLGGAMMAGQLLKSFLFGVGPTDIWTLATVCAVLGLVSAMACLLPALRATRVSPIVALRME
jgi:putative ABC transport system permease protein